MKNLGIALATWIALAMYSICAPAHGAPMQSGPFNRIVVLVDATDSFKQRRLEAVERTQQLVQQLTARKAKRWEAVDQIVIISLDAIPEVLWEGDARTLAQTKRGDWVSRFKARSDYARCTDVDAALNLALTALERAPQPAGKYLIGFSDLIHEPPLQTPSKCKPPKLPSVPGKDFAWDRLADVSVAMFWLPPSQKLAWDRTMKENGLTTFKLYTSSESSAVEIDVPKPPVRELSEKEQERVLGTLSGGVDVVVKILVVLFILGVVGIGAYLVVVWIRSRRNQRGLPGASKTGGGVGRRVTGDVKPMSLPPRR